MDIATNPKTGENVPNEMSTAASMIIDRISETVSSLEEIVLFIKDNTKLSHESIDTAIDELKSYADSLNKEKDSSMKNLIN